MSESNQEGYQTLGWIINKSEQGLYLAAAPKSIQDEIVRIYQSGPVAIYDYKQHPGAYSFQNLSKWIASVPESSTFLIMNFQFALQEEEDFKRLNFSRDMLAGLGKNLVFVTTPYGDDQLAVSAYDFYSFVKLRIIFCEYEAEGNVHNSERTSAEGIFLWESGSEPGESRHQMQKTNVFMKRAEEAQEKGKYEISEGFLRRAKEICEKLLGDYHIETVKVYVALAHLYYLQGKWTEAVGLYEKALPIIEDVIGENNPYTTANYGALAGLYKEQGRYKDSENLYKKTIAIQEKILGANHPYTIISYKNLALLYEEQGRYKSAEELYKKALEKQKTVSGENHPDTSSTKDFTR